MNGIQWATIQVSGNNAGHLVPDDGSCDLSGATIGHQSVAGWREQAGVNRHKAWQEGKLHRDSSNEGLYPGIQAWLSSIPPMVGVVTPAAAQSHLYYLWERLHEALAHFGLYQQHRAHRWQAHIARERALHRMMQRVISQDPKWPAAHTDQTQAVVAWGNGSCGEGSTILSRAGLFPQVSGHNVHVSTF
jgi:hypothetical protein